MSKDLSYRKAVKEDLSNIIALLAEDDLGKTREGLGGEIDAAYLKAFELIDKDPNQYLMVVILGHQIVATCHLTIIPYLIMKGTIRMQIEGVHVAEQFRGQKIGEWMMQEAIKYGKARGATLIQLTTNKVRVRAKKFYENIGFVATHEGMKLFV